MKKKIYLTFFSLLLMVAAMGQIPFKAPLNPAFLSPSGALSVRAGELAANEEYISYCQNPAPFLRMQVETYDMASYYDEMLVGKYVGDKINKVRVYIGGEVKALTVWLREKLNEEPVFSQAIDTDKLSQAGWIEVELPAEKAYTIKKGGYYVGYTITQKKVNADDKTYYPLAASAEGTLMKNTFMCSENGGANWIDYTAAYYAQYEYILVLGTQTAIVSDKHVDQDVSLAHFTGESRVIKRDKQAGKAKINYYGYVFNSGKEPITSFDLEVSAPNVEPVSKTIKLGGKGLPTYRGVMLKGSIEVPNDAASTQLNMKAKNINAGAFTDGYEANNETSTESFYFYDESSAKTALIEMYTTVQCPNCPKGHKVIEALPTDCKKVVVAHHVGFGEDIYTLQGSNNYMYEFGVKGAPSATVNRTYLVNNGGTSFSIGYPNASQGASDVLASIEEAEAILPAFATIAIVPAYNENTHELTLTVSGEKTYPELYDAIMKKSCVNVFITEDGIEGSQSGAGKYIHSHVIRAILGGAWGTEVTWNGNSYTTEFHTTIDAAWNTDNLRIVAFLSDEDPDNSYYHNAMNATEVNLDGTSGIDETALSDLQVVAEDGTIQVIGNYDNYRIYNTQGMQVKNEGLQSGIYLVRIEVGQKSIACKIAIY